MRQKNTDASPATASLASASISYFRFQAVRLSAVIQPPASISYFLCPLSYFLITGNPETSCQLQLHLPDALQLHMPMEMACAAGAGPNPMHMGRG
jgi:hypothetical protein